MARPPFSMLRACFYLLAIVVLVVMLETLIAMLGCAWLIVIARVEPIGACQQVGTQIREVLSEMLTAILALLVASRGGSPPTKPPDDGGV